MKKISLFVAGMLLFVISVMAQTISSFTSTPSTVPCGGSANLNWVISGAATAHLSGGPVSMIVPISGSMVVPSLTSTTTFLLTAYASGGAEVSQTITVNVVVLYDTVDGMVVTKNLLPKEIEYSFITQDTLYLIDSGKVIVRDSAVVTVSAIDTIRTVEDRQYRRNTCTGDTIYYMVISSWEDTLRGPVLFDTVHYQTIKIIPVGIDDIPSEAKQRKVVIFPNPSYGTFSISQPGIWNVRVTDISGKAVYVSQGNGITQVKTDLAPGVYILSVANEKGVHRQKIIIQ